MKIPYANNFFNISSIAYGIRNVADPHKALCEMARVVQSGGYVMVLETGGQRSPLLQAPIDLYFKYFVPYVGGWFSGNSKAYSYLNQSSQSFPSRESFVDMMMGTGKFKSVQYKSLM